MGALLYFIILTLVCLVGRSAASYARERRKALSRSRTVTQTQQYPTEKPVRLEAETNGTTLLDEKHALIEEELEVGNTMINPTVQGYGHSEMDNGLPMFRVRQTLLGYSPSFGYDFGAIDGEMSEEDKMALRRELRQRLRVIIPGAKPPKFRDAPPPYSECNNGFVATRMYNSVAPPMKIRRETISKRPINGHHVKGSDGTDNEKLKIRVNASGVQTRAPSSDIRSRTRGLQRVGVMRVGRLDRQMRAGTGLVSDEYV